MTPKEVLALCREKNVKAVDLRFMDFPGLWQHFTIPVNQLERRRLRGRVGIRRLQHPRLAGDQRERHARRAPARDGHPGPLLHDPDAVDDLQHPGPGYPRGLHPRSPQHRPQGRKLPEEHRHRRHLPTSARRSSSSSSTTSATTKRPTAASTSSTASRGSGTAGARNARTWATSSATRKAISPCRRPTS